MQETWVRSLGQEYPLEKGIATHSCILAWRILWTEESGRLQSLGLLQGHKESDATNTFHFHFSCWDNRTFFTERDEGSKI